MGDETGEEQSGRRMQADEELPEVLLGRSADGGRDGRGEIVDFAVGGCGALEIEGEGQ